LAFRYCFISLTPTKTTLDMELSQATQILERHNLWRRGAEIPMENPTDLGIAIDIILNHLTSPKISEDDLVLAFKRGYEKRVQEQLQRALDDLPQTSSYNDEVLHESATNYAKKGQL